MANSTTNLDTISSSQASKEVTANALFDAGSPATLYGRRASTTANLTWGYYGGMLGIAGVPTAIANGTVALTNGATNYFTAERTTGNVAMSTSNTSWNDTANHARLYSVVTSGNMVTSYTDHRAFNLNEPAAGATFANLGGSSSQTFMVAPPTAANQAARLDSVSLFPSVASNTTVDIFGAAGATISITGNTTTTGFTACTAAQVGSVKRIVNASAWPVTASASMTVNGFTSGDYSFPANSIIEVLALTTTTFAIFGTVVDTITVTLSGSTGNPTTPVTTAATRVIPAKTKLVTLDFAFSNVSTVGASGFLRVTGATPANATAPFGSCDAAGFTTTAPVLRINASIIAVQEAGTTGAVSMTAGTGKYLRGSITYLGA